MYKYQIVAAACFLVALFTAVGILQRFLPDRLRTWRATLAEGFWMVVLWGVTLGPAVYLNPVLRGRVNRWLALLGPRPPVGQPTGSRWWNPELSRVDEVLFWMLFGSAVLVALRTLTHPRWRLPTRLIVAAGGFVAAFGALVGLRTLFG